MTMIKVPAVAHEAYVACALWSSTDEDGEPLDGIGAELADEARATMAEDLQAFADLVYAEVPDWHTRLDWAQLAHDFWLDLIATPDELVRPRRSGRRQPTGVLRDHLSEEQRAKIPVLRRLLDRSSSSR